MAGEVETGAPLIGASVSTRGGIDKAVDNAVRIGAEVFQTHPTPAVTWRPLRVDDIVLDAYRRKYAAAGLHGHYLHAVYLINLASPKPTLLKQSVASLVHYMELAQRLDADGVVFHPGSHLGAGFAATLPQMGAALREVIDRSPAGDTLLLVENSAGSGGCVGCSLEEVARIVEAASSDRVAVCLDTQHAFASGYDLRTAEGARETLDEFDRLIGFERLALVHANDSRPGLGSATDRHANLGQGRDRPGGLPPAARGSAAQARAMDPGGAGRHAGGSRPAQHQSAPIVRGTASGLSDSGARGLIAATSHPRD